MVEDAPVNTGAVVWPESDSAWATVRRMQLKLHRWAVDDPDRRFGDLFNLVYDPAFLVQAWERVAYNTGARTGGVDRATVATIIRRTGVAPFLQGVRDQLKSGTFRPVPVREVRIPKAAGKTQRLGIPTVADRVVQAAVKLVLEPIFEADFKPCSYGFRPRRRAGRDRGDSAHDHLWLRVGARGRHRGVFRSDRSCRVAGSGAVPGLGQAAARVGEGLPESRCHDQHRGSGGHSHRHPPGGILSPLLANIALSVLDEQFDAQWHREMGTWHQRDRRRRRGEGSWKLVRYADDFVVCVNGQRQHAEAVRDQVVATLAPMGLALAPDKTRVVHIDEGFDFLGFHMRRMRKRGTQKRYVYTVPSAKAIASIREKVRAKTSRSTLHRDLDELLRGLNQVMRGWANYFRHGVAKRVFGVLDSYAWRRIVTWIRRKHNRISWKELRRRFCTRGCRLAHNGIAFTGASSVAVTRYRYRGHSIATPWTHRQPARADQRARHAESPVR